jgi:hypothetical protein
MEIRRLPSSVPARNDPAKAEASDDKAVVRPVVDRLKAYGWTLYFSGDNSEAGQIDENCRSSPAKRLQTTRAVRSRYRTGRSARQVSEIW